MARAAASAAAEVAKPTADVFRQMVKEGRMLAPNIKQAHFWKFSNGSAPGNRAVNRVVKKHLLAVRWMNPNAMVYLREARVPGKALVEFECWDGFKAGFDVEPMDEAELMAEVLRLGRDPADDPPAYREYVLKARSAGRIEMPLEQFEELGAEAAEASIAQPEEDA